MITQDLAAAQILFILASDNAAQLKDLARDLQQSKYRYYFAPHTDRTNLLQSVKQQIAANNARIPAVLVINYDFAGNDCESLVELVHITGKSAAIECLVTQPPKHEVTRERLVNLGARLFDGEGSRTMAELTLH